MWTFYLEFGNGEWKFEHRNGEFQIGKWKLEVEIESRTSGTHVENLILESGN